MNKFEERGKESGSFNCSRTKCVVIFVNVFGSTVYELFFDHSLSSQVTFFRFRSSFLSDLYCAHSELKLVAKIKLIETY